MRIFALVLAVFILQSSSFILPGAKRPNILLICVDDLRPELNCFGKSYIYSPNIDALAARGRVFDRSLF